MALVKASKHPGRVGRVDDMTPLCNIDLCKMRQDDDENSYNNAAGHAAI
jgi:hypothetical protein